MQFQTGKTYTARSACDHNCIFAFTVEKRTEKTITIRHHADNRIKRVGVKMGSDGIEWALPLGRYSMAPTITADRT